MKILVTGGSGFIGTNLIERLIALKTYVIKNVDVSEPKDTSHAKYWENVDLLDKARLQKIVSEFQPEVVVHLAARTDTDPKNTIDDYKVNIVGSQNLIDVIAETASVKRVVFTSTQFVHQYKGDPKHDQDFAPHTVYGESKVLMEKAIRAKNLTSAWVIIRPTNIWGPWHLRYPFEFWKVLANGLYFHPGKKPVIRSYGYVGNVVTQIISLLSLKVELVDRQVFYVGDPAIDLYEWVNGFSLGQTGKNVRVVPRWIIRTLGYVGDVLAVGNIRFPITSSRFKSMTTDNTAPMSKTIALLGVPPYSLQAGIQETVTWLKKYHPDLVKN